MGCGASAEVALSAAHQPGSAGRRGKDGFWKEASATAVEPLTEPWESTVRSGFPAAAHADAVDEDRRLSFGDAERTAYAKRQLGASNEAARLAAYLEAGTAMAAARGAPEGSPRRGQPGWFDSDVEEACVHTTHPAAEEAGRRLTVHGATAAGTRGAGSGRPNQDCYSLTDALLAPHHALTYSALFDGHGPHGHFIARHVRDRLPAWVASCAADGYALAAPRPGVPPWVLRAGAVYWLHPVTLALERRPSTGACGAPPWAPALGRAFLELDGDLCAQRSQLLAASKVSADQSGCCAVVAVVGDGHAVVAGAGDSAAFLAVELPPGSAAAAAAAAAAAVAAPPPPASSSSPPPSAGRRGSLDVAGCARPLYACARLSLLHKPAGEEAIRVRQAGGRVAAHQGEEHIPRVWPKPVEGTAACGLAVARAFGDVAWKAAGVCAAPDVVVRALQPADAFVLLCSDGVTDAMSGAAAVTCAADALHRGAGAGGGGGGGRGGGRAAAEANAAAAVVEAAKKAWAQRFPRHARDDITALVVLLRPLAAGGDAR